MLKTIDDKIHSDWWEDVLILVTWLVAEHYRLWQSTVKSQRIGVSLVEIPSYKEYIHTIESKIKIYLK